MIKKHGSTLLFILIMGFLLYTRLPLWIEQYRSEGQTAPSAEVQILGQTLGELWPHKDQCSLLIFWATWCAPCKLEMTRINSWAKSNPQFASQIMALSSGETLETVTAHVSKNPLLYKIGWEPKYLMAQQYKVKGTPTLVLVDKNQTIQWMSTGISPSLELRLSQFFTGENTCAPTLKATN